MPCSGSNTTECKIPGIEGSQNSAAQENLGFVTGDPSGVFAHMGWVGFAKLKIPHLDPNGTVLRVTSADINLKQDISMPDVIDGRIDKTVYQLGPKIVEGSLSMPVIADVDPTAFSGGCVNAQDLQSGTANTLIDNLWCWTTARGPHGRLQYTDASIDIRYANHAAFSFDRTLVNTLSMNVAKEDMVTFDIDVIGRKRISAIDSGDQFPFNNITAGDFLSPARVITWNDVTVSGIGGCDSARLFGSAQIREFSFEINNNAERYYSLNGQLFPIDINVSKREITGSLTLLGLQEQLRLRGENQQGHFTRKDEIRLQIFIGDEATGSRDWFSNSDTPQSPGGASLSPIFFKKFGGVIFQIEEMSLTNEVFETTVNWMSLAVDTNGYTSISPSSSCVFPSWS